MTAPDLMQCDKPLIFENEDEDFSFSMQGTSFLVHLGTQYYVVKFSSVWRDDFLIAYGYFNFVNDAFAFCNAFIFVWTRPDSFHGEPFQSVTQRFQTFSFDHDDSVLKLDFHNVLAALPDEFCVL